MSDACLHELFEAQARATPDAVALVWGTDELTYRELDRRSAIVARELRALGVGPERNVGLCVDRSLELVIAMLGILRAGGAYVALDPRYPAERLRYMLETTGAEIAVVGRGAALPVAPRHVMTIDAALWTRPADPIASGARPENVAVVIFTSGSQGRPKGVCLEHRTLANRVRWQMQAFPPDAFDGVLAAASIAFDASVAEIFSPLCRRC